MLDAAALLEAEGVRVHDVRCSASPSGWSAAEEVRGFSLVLVRRGVFRRRADGRERLLDVTTAYVQTPGSEQRVAHPCAGGDRCTTIALEPALLASVWGGEQDVSPLVLHTPPAADLDHRRLVAACAAGADPFVAAEDALALAATLLAQGDARRVAAGAPTTAARRRRLADDAREALGADPGLGLRALAREVGASPHHLSRVFRAETGTTVSRHRLRLRVRLALERLAAGEADLARLAADLGFSSHAHLTRAVRQETGGPPSALRARLS